MPYREEIKFRYAFSLLTYPQAGSKFVSCNDTICNKLCADLCNNGLNITGLCLTTITRQAIQVLTTSEHPYI